MHRPMGNASLMVTLLPKKVGRDARLEQLDAYKAHLEVDAGSDGPC